MFAQLTGDVSLGEIGVQTETDVVRGKFGEVLEACFSQTPAVFIRTNDALHIASALVAGEKELVTADGRQRAAGTLMGLAVLP